MISQVSGMDLVKKALGRDSQGNIVSSARGTDFLIFFYFIILNFCGTGA
jgi:hypothetical protein